VCDAVQGIFLNGPDLRALQAGAERARTGGIDAVFVGDGPAGDAIVLTAGLAARIPDLLFGVRVGLRPQSDRYPTVLAREMTTLDRVTGGRVLLALTGPFNDATAEAIGLCQEMWTLGIGVSDGPSFPAVGAINRPLPERPGGPPIALDLTDGAVARPAHLVACALVLVAAGGTPPAALPPGVEVCWVQPCMAM
jgi:alkanesulfonate monooxygenase SsuD/methylene tetrahydromethanopterin reductase-like flavin-dependent oxidoreductase (luciferase family)